MADLMQLIRRALGHESTPITVAAMPSVNATNPARLLDQERRIGILEDKVKVQTARLTKHIENHGAN